MLRNNIETIQVFFSCANEFDKNPIKQSKNLSYFNLGVLQNVRLIIDEIIKNINCINVKSDYVRKTLIFEGGQQQSC